MGLALIEILIPVLATDSDQGCLKAVDVIEPTCENGSEEIYARWRNPEKLAARAIRYLGPASILVNPYLRGTAGVATV
ncbi:MAG: hypothetical protein WBP55_09700, partial [Solirubrobacterales bacterium]